MKPKLIRTLEILLGLFIAVIGLNKFLEFTEIPSPPGAGGELMSIYISSGFLKLVGLLEIIAGLMVAARKFTAIGLTLITAIMFNAMLFHLFHDPSGAAPATISLILAVVLIFIDRSNRHFYLRS
ncbi:MAG: DoxX family protein [Bacteroidota bacterium]